MPEIRIYDPPTVEAPTFRPLGLVLAATDVTLIERHWSPGSFTLSVPLGARHEDRLTGGGGRSGGAAHLPACCG